ncbi:MAG TPA: hypothetical protein VK738_04275 [Terriglobales bacterium]|nr:hypothetical protein [Terriglobales bacterium]
MKIEHGKRFIRYRHGGFQSVHLNAIHYLPSENGDRQYAIVSYTLQGGYGSSTVEGIAQVFELTAHHLMTIEQLEWDNDFVTSKPYLSFNEKSRRLIVRSGHPLPGDAKCCVSAMDVFTLHWEGNRFVELGMHTELSDEGIRAGKKL